MQPKKVGSLCVGWSLPLGCCSLFAQSSQSDVVRVFILAGQSTMECKAANKLLEHQATDPRTRHVFAHLRKDDLWILRNDVFTGRFG
jgi:alpha-galactosidase